MQVRTHQTRLQQNIITSFWRQITNGCKLGLPRISRSVSATAGTTVSGVSSFNLPYTTQRVYSHLNNMSNSKREGAFTLQELLQPQRIVHGELAGECQCLPVPLFFFDILPSKHQLPLSTVSLLILSLLRLPTSLLTQWCCQNLARTGWEVLSNTKKEKERKKRMTVWWLRKCG